MTQTLALGRVNPDGPNPYRGFTLIELLVVLVIIGVLLGLAGFNLTPFSGNLLEQEAQRLLINLQTAQQEAILRGRHYLLVIGKEGYEFHRLSDEGKFEKLESHPVLGSQVFSSSIQLSEITIAEHDNPSDHYRVILDPNGYFTPFTIILANDNEQWKLHGELNGRVYAQLLPNASR